MLLCVCNMSGPGTGEQTEALLNAGVLISLGKVLSATQSTNEAVRKEACWTVANITAGSSEQIGRVMEARGVVESLIMLLGDGQTDIETRLRAAEALTNITVGGTRRDIASVVEAGCLAAMTCLMAESDDALVLCTVMEGVVDFALLRFCSLGGGRRSRHCTQLSGGTTTPAYLRPSPPPAPRQQRPRFCAPSFTSRPTHGRPSSPLPLPHLKAFPLPLSPLLPLCA